MIAIALYRVDPTASLGADFGSVFMSSDRFAILSNQYGALNPEFAAYMGGHDSRFSNLVANDGTEADVYERQGNIYTGLHVLSSAFDGSHGTNAPSNLTDWSSIPPFAGMATYGFESSKNVFLSNMQCDNAWSACVFVGTAGKGAGDSPTVISNVAQKCSGFINVWPTYHAVQVAATTGGAAVSNVDADPSCGIPNSQLISFDNPLDGTLAAAQNPAAQYCMPGRGYHAGRYYTTPYTTGAVAAVVTGTLYAIPVPIACTVTISSLSTLVSSVVTSPPTMCEYGVYDDNGTGQPGSLIVDGGPLTVIGSTTPQSKAVSAQLAPGLVFLVVGCNSTPTLQSGANPGTLLGSLIGFTAPSVPNALIVNGSGWSFGTLPTTFPNPTYATPTTLAPLVFLTP